MSGDTTRQSKNEIFTSGMPSGPQHGGQPGMQTSNVMKDDFGFDVPVENVPLPSRGLIYGEGSPLQGQETIQIKAMTAREEDILTSKALIRKGTVISELIKSCLINKDIDVNDMLIGDRNALMTAIRITGYGGEYPIEVDCPACSERSKQEFNLAELPIKRLEVSPIAAGANLFETQLPMTKKTIRYRLMTGNDEREMMVIAERKKKSGMQTDALITERFSRQIMAIDNVTDKNKISFFVRNMPARDSLYLRKFIDKTEPGIEMKGWMECVHCGEHSEVRLPMGAAFFWPDA
ncbi:MAG: hypothetical protein CMB80_09375 [Flammeovirgaceae bacterium]|nr:hypothetical protein [Flammeovirgaceae bacterium]|tara:strand:- start:1460 stop:2335 length:876 start_codon:yes stop_codon:yes gene_type:complete